MPTFITIGNFTEKGKKMLNDADQMKKYVEGIKKISTAIGGKYIGAYVTMGQYDFVMINEYPNEEVALKMMLKAGANGNSQTQTMTAVSLEHAIELMES